MTESKDDLPVYTSQDFGAVNDYVAHLSQRHQALRDNWKADTFGMYFKWFSIFILSVGVVVFLTLLGLSMLRERPEPRIIEPVVVDKQITIIVPEGYAGDSPAVVSDIESNVPIIRKIVNNVEVGNNHLPVSSDIPSKTVVNFVIFKEIEFGRSGLGDVLVGMEYNNLNSVKPSKQWCYLTRNNLSGTSTRIELASKTGDRPVLLELSVREAKEVRVTLSVLKSAQRLCRFE